MQGELRISDITGREVYREKINAAHIEVNVSTLPTGYYTLSIEAGTKTIREKLIIAR